MGIYTFGEGVSLICVASDHDANKKYTVAGHGNLCFYLLVQFWIVVVHVSGHTVHQLV